MQLLEDNMADIEISHQLFDLLHHGFFHVVHVSPFLGLVKELDEGEGGIP